MVKLSDERVRWLVSRVVEYGDKPCDVAGVYGVSVRRVQQLVKEFRSTGVMPVLSVKRRPMTFLSEEQKEAIDRAFEETRFGARLLYHELKAREIKVPKNKLYVYMKEKGWVVPNPKKQKKRKRCRYERKHSGSLIHGDSHRTSVKHPYCILWMDDASRKVLGGRETKEAVNNHVSIETCKEAIEKAAEYNVFIEQVNTDRGTEFFSNKKKMKKGSKSKFEQFLLQQGIKHIPSRVNNPQTNGKLERHWLEYDRHRWRFENLQEYIDWYNNRLHGALRLEWAETPKQAFIRKMTPESMIGLMLK